MCRYHLQRDYDSGAVHANRAPPSPPRPQRLGGAGEREAPLLPELQRAARAARKRQPARAVAKGFHVQLNGAADLDADVGQHRIGQVAVLAHLDPLPERLQPLHQHESGSRPGWIHRTSSETTLPPARPATSNAAPPRSSALVPRPLITGLLPLFLRVARPIAYSSPLVGRTQPARAWADRTTIVAPPRRATKDARRDPVILDP